MHHFGFTQGGLDTAFRILSRIRETQYLTFVGKNLGPVVAVLLWTWDNVAPDSLTHW